MSKLTREYEEMDIEEAYDVDIGDDDYGFIISADGELKSVFLPNSVPFEVPDTVLKILKMFGINDVEEIEHPSTLQ
jgi:hypothetical protein